VCVGNFSPVFRERHHLGLPRAGEYNLIINTGAGVYGGSGVDVPQLIAAGETPLHGQPYSATITLPPLSTLWFEAPRE
jgi:1,4-alpha-glucan branching enzyme